MTEEREDLVIVIDIVRIQRVGAQTELRKHTL